MAKEIVLTVMGALVKGDSLLVQNRTKTDWPGLTLSGGKVEDKESIKEAIKREFLEETGLEVEDWHFENYIEWNIKEERHLCLLFKAFEFKGTLIQATSEGANLWLKIKEIKDAGNFSDDFDKILDLLKIDWR